MGEINKKISGKANITSGESNRHADGFVEVMKDLTPYDQMVIRDQRELLVTSIRGLGDKGATELLGKLGMWLVMNNVNLDHRAMMRELY